jgi:hypothetical protein
VLIGPSLVNDLTPFRKSSILEDVRSVVRRLASLVAVLALSTSAWAQCAGWQNTAEARMACCADGEQCPMHAARSGGAQGDRRITQAQADACCTLSERSSSTTPSASTHVATITFAPVPTLVSFVLPDATSIRDGWRTLVPISASPVPRHLLLSVFLV